MKFKSLARAVALIMAFAVLAFAFGGCSTSSEEGGSSTMGTIQMVGMIVLLVIVFYFFMIRPESKKKKKAQEMREALSVGDRVTTIGGITGKVVSIKDDSITFETGEDRVRVEVTKWAISSTGKDTQEPSK